MKLLTLLEAALNDQTATRQTDLIEDTFGPNPCTSLVLTHENGDTISMPCDGKRCVHCGPRKQATMTNQLTQAMGDYTYIRRIATRDELNRTIARLKKASQRSGDEFLYQATGDDYAQYILITNVPSYEDQNRTSLTDWLKRIIHSWLYGDSRIRRTRRIGRLSLLHLRRRGQVGTSPWQRVSTFLLNPFEKRRELEMARRDAIVDAVGWQVWEEDTRIESSISAWSLQNV